MMTPKQKTARQLEMTTAHDTHQKGLHAHAFFKMNDRTMSEDMVQDTFSKTWLYLVKGGKIEVMKAFLYHVLNNLIVDEYRKHKTISLDALLAKGYEPSEEDSDRVTTAADQKAVLLLIMRLPEKYRRVMRMRHIENRSLSDIAAAIKQSKNATAVQLHRGLAKLKVLYHIL